MISRKNWLFNHTATGAHASAALYSIIEAAKTNGLMPFDYMMYLLEYVAAQNTDVQQLLAWRFAKD